jgi:glutamine amidotransferase
MCRHLAYLGPPVSLASCVLEPPHSLQHQSWAPDDMRHGGTINADGFGIGWLDAEVGVARRYRRATPIWSDASLPDLAASVSSGAFLAAVRSATVGMPVTETACAPFIDGSAMFSHNGRVVGWPDSVAPLARSLSPATLMTLDAPTDSAFLWALVRQRLFEGHSAATVLTGAVSEVLSVSPDSRLNLLLLNDKEITATTVGHSLWVRQGESSITVSSEPLDPQDEGWQAVPDLCLLQATTTSFLIRPLEPEQQGLLPYEQGCS